MSQSLLQEVVTPSDPPQWSGHLPQGRTSTFALLGISRGYHLQHKCPLLGGVDCVAIRGDCVAIRGGFVIMPELLIRTNKNAPANTRALSNGESVQ